MARVPWWIRFREWLADRSSAFQYPVMRPDEVVRWEQRPSFGQRLVAFARWIEEGILLFTTLIWGILGVVVGLGVAAVVGTIAWAILSSIF
ncbi:hypothetical protein EO087_00255 [Dyella sp. M7H15-1]|uniref:hypothetical protein n=1 Tax=Dyella sp. M7H15-1 TaxID=2501295 RepID=UPI001004F91A|nr:hypothetical protein [Dyella sp. M7H15-1]QAU22597.1 hypothetical protein EO087_00255 [Dyella sp. M7H15-1]